MKLKKTFIVTFTMLLIVFLGSCRATQTKCNSSLRIETDSIQRDMGLNDSLNAIIHHSKDIKCYLLTKNPAVPARIDSVRAVSNNLRSVIKFLITDPQNFISNDIVYGNFSPCAKYTFNAKKGKKVEFELDFGLRKWRLLNKENKILASGDMKATNIQLLRLTRIIFPNDSTLNILNENLNTK